MFFGSRERSRARRRGVILILVLGMLALMALIGVTFATFAGQQLVNSRNFSQSINFPNYDEVMDWGLAQLINDTSNPTSAIRGHGLTRDMYGNDSLLTGQSGTFGGYMTSLPDGTALQITQLANPATSNSYPYDYSYLYRYVTNIPTSSLNIQLANLDFTHWVLTIKPITMTEGQPGNAAYQEAVLQVAQTFEVLADDRTSNYHVFTLSPADPLDQTGSLTTLGYPVTRVYNNPSRPHLYDPTSSANELQKRVSFMSQPPPPLPTGATAPETALSWPSAPYYNWLVAQTAGANVQFTLDSRFMRAFNGPGMTHANYAGLPDATYNGAGQPHNSAAYANFRTNGGLLRYPWTNTLPSTPSFGSPDDYGMDEDYDACDLENWFLGIQSADGQVVIPSFHRPGILTAADWSNTLGSNGAAAIMSVSKILRPRQVDNSPAFPADPVPDQTTGRIKYDIDNDGDGVTDSVWLDLGYPSQRDTNGRAFKPLFAFMIIGLNGRLPLNTVGNLQARDFQTATTASTPAPFAYEWYPDNYLDGPSWTHASHLGYSVNEVNPLFALQNAPNSVYGNPAAVIGGSAPLFAQADNATPNPTGTTFGGVDIATTQLRNLLAGTIPQDSLINPNLTLNFDHNTVLVNGTPWYVPNGVVDNQDVINPGSQGTPPSVPRYNAPVAGRWGERNGIPSALDAQPHALPITRTTPTSNLPVYSFVYTNPVRAGRSYAPQAGLAYLSTIDSMDDDADAQDHFPGTFNFVGTVTPNPSGLANNTSYPQYTPSPAEGYGALPTTGVVSGTPTPFVAGDLYDDAAGQLLPVERIRRFVNPIDPGGVGRVVDWSNRPRHAYDFGNGYDKFGRVGFFRYFRPAGMPKQVAYYTGPGVAGYPYTDSNPLPANINNYNQPVLLDPTIPDRTNNLFHAWMAAALPIAGITGSGAEGIAVGAAMPFDLVLSTGAPAVWSTPEATSGTYTLPPAPFIPSINVNAPSTMTHFVNSGQGPHLGSYSASTPMGIIPPLHPVDPNPVGGNSPRVTVVNSYPNYPLTDPNGNFVGGSLNKDEADEMNPWNPGLWDSAYNASDLEWLYRKQDVDGASLTSRLSLLAPVSFTNPADGTTRRRLFSVESFDTNTFNFAPDQPLPLNAQSQDFTYNSRFASVTNYSSGNPLGNLNQYASPFVPNASFAAMGYNTNASNYQYPSYANTFPLTQIPNPVAYGNSPTIHTGGIPTVFPYVPAVNVSNQLTPTVTPAAANRDRRVNLNYPLPVSNDTTEPVRQKLIRELYQLFKAVLPPQATDTPQELAALSQYAVNIVDFRDPDCTSTRFVNTDLMVIPATNTTAAYVVFANKVFPPNNGVNGHFPYDPTILNEQTYPTTSRNANWTAFTSATPASLGDFLVQHGMEYSPIAFNEVLAYGYPIKQGSGASATSKAYTRVILELVNMLTDDGTAAGGSSASDLRSRDIDGWEIVITDDSYGTGRPDPTTGDLPQTAFATFSPATAPFLAKATFADTTNVTRTSATPAPTNPITMVSPAATINALTNSASTFFTIDTQDPATAGASGPNPETVPILPGASTANNFTFAYAGPTGTGTVPFVLPVPPAASGGLGGTGATQWLWAYLRRPANPFDRSPYNPVPSATGGFYDTTEMVVVDSIRFPFTYSPGSGKYNAVTMKDEATQQPSALYSAMRHQPYRGGQSVPALTGTPGSPNPPYAYGYSEQTIDPNLAGGTTTSVAWGSSASNTTLKILDTIHHSIGAANNNADAHWDYFPFHDRDFMSPAELLLVPGCPPGLFTKQFVEQNDIAAPVTPPLPAATISTGYNTLLTTTATGNFAKQFNSGVNKNEVHTYPYLNDEFFYTGSSVNPSTAASVPNYPAHVGNLTGDGWYRLLEFVEVPSSANGAIGPVAQGANFDWLRNDTRPGLLNLNLIIDEEVFFGLLDEARLNTWLTHDPNFATTVAGLQSFLPRVVSQIDVNGYPAYLNSGGTINPYGSYRVSDLLTPQGGAYQGRGYTYTNPNASIGSTAFGVETQGMKAAFSDFLKLRHGGSGYLFGFGSGVTGAGPAFDPALGGTAPVSPYYGTYTQGNQTHTVGVAVERPFRSLSYPDINYTVMRPATLPPSALTSPNATYPAPYHYYWSTTMAATDYGNYFADANGNVVYPDRTQIYNPNGTPPVLPPYAGDPGVRNPFLLAPLPTTTIMPSPPANPFNNRGVPLVPPRRLFAIPDYADGINPYNRPASGNAAYPVDTTVGGTGNPLVYVPNQPILLPGLNNRQTANLFASDATVVVRGSSVNPIDFNHYLGGGSAYVYPPVMPPPPPAPLDFRQHPYYRTEILQKVMNLTTVRTHQFACWLTVGFFEVLQPGSPALGVPDILGGELGLLAGKNRRYRGFFLLDRTKAVGFNVHTPAPFNSLITYRRRIE